jgi:hypothetical protein
MLHLQALVAGADKLRRELFYNLFLQVVWFSALEANRK